ncbi:TonB-dependent receptor [Polymorphobacter fuscus]|uniref:TonB-dependent receptor plug domain-containing protein n=2 Tax=Sandarakinorhabdus fusca TaxID=1439888 RepID=A0A7C9GUN3_9SPHN|nr:TonB-dependent receptor [Polymorphobacter fuscus]KAB7648023.1 TonB-dependent receptor plug domain-containing protein [Polymorphobacter fuscus]MQT17058.1 TonB-dependent receptor plug domain-containing protein [Polymorphobacter fuscus]NJC08950.1 catecholate siderophore receptor [Polymorphobacter fuscus]
MHRTNDRRPIAASFLALGCVGVLHTAPTAAEVIEAAEAPAIVVTGHRDVVLESPKSTAPLLDTPQTVTVIGDQVIRKQNLLTLRDVLAVVPGITFGAGEGGGGYGDSINLRGYSANNDITQDGVRDSAQYSRTDPFNLQQIEVYNGANSVFNGSGSVGGTINIVSKVPQANDLTVISGGIGTDSYYRGTIDSNVRAGDLVAVRLNAMIHRNDVPGRDVERFKRWGVAPSITLGVEGPTSLTLAYLHQRDDNTPVFGVPYFKSSVNAGPLPEADRSDYFGIVNLDAQQITVDRLTATARHAFSDAVVLRNLSRWQRVAQDTVTSAPQGTFCLTGSGRQPVGANGTATQGLACPATLAPGLYQPSGPRGLVRDQINEIMVNQTDLRIVSGEKGRLRNTLVVGASFSWEDYDIVSGSLIRDAAGNALTLPTIAIANPDTTYTGPVNRTVTAQSRSSTTNKAVYAFDTLEIGEMFELNGAVRYENNKANFRNLALGFVPPGTAALTPAQQASQVSDENLFSYRGGLVFKPVKTVSLYAAYGNAKTPSSATVRLGCGIPAPGAADLCAVAPETARNYEIGAKADLFDRKLQLTAALFRNERSNFRTPSNDPSLPTSLQVLDGRSRVDGVALGASGSITPAWTLFANYTYLDGKVLQSVSNFCLANPGTTGCANTAAIPDPQAGNQLIQTPKHSGSLFTSYRLPFGLELGYGFTYQGSFATNQSVLANPVQYRVEDYLIHRAFLSYAFAQGITAQLNIQNFTNEKYFTGVRNNVNATTGAVTGGWAVPGDGRSAVLSVFYSF